MANKSLLKAYVWKNLVDARVEAENTLDINNFWLGWHFVANFIFNPISTADLLAIKSTFTLNDS